MDAEGELVGGGGDGPKKGETEGEGTNGVSSSDGSKESNATVNSVAEEKDVTKSESGEGDGDNDGGDEPEIVFQTLPSTTTPGPRALSILGGLNNAPEPLATPSGIRFVADLPLRKNELGYEYVHLFLEEQDDPPALDVLFTEIDYSHMVWEIRRGNVLLLEALNEDSVINELLNQIHNLGREYPPTGSVDTSTGELALKYTATSIDLLTWEAKNGMLYVPNEAAIQKVIKFLFSLFLDDPSKPMPYQVPPRQISNITEILAYNPRSRDKVIAYLITTDPQSFIRSLLSHLEYIPVFNLALTLTALLSPCPPIAAQPPNQLKFRIKRHSTAYGTDPLLALQFNQWLSKGGFVAALLDAFLQKGEKRVYNGEVTENCAALLMEIISVSERQISKGMEPPTILTELMQEATLKEFISSVLSHSETKVLAEGVGVFEKMLLYDQTRRTVAKQSPAGASSKKTEEAIDPAHALLQIIRLHVDLLFKRMDLSGAVSAPSLSEKEKEKDKEKEKEKEEEEKLKGTSTQRRRFGLTRLRLLEFVERLLAHFLSENVASEDCDDFLKSLHAVKFWSCLLDTLFTYELNNLLHILVAQIVGVIFDSNQQKIQIQILTEENLLDKIVAADKASTKECEEKGLGFRKPFMGAITEISVILQRTASRDPVIAKILDGHEGWKAYEEGSLRRIVAIHNRARDPVQEQPTNMYTSIPLALLAKIFASQAAAAKKQQESEEAHSRQLQGNHGDEHDDEEEEDDGEDAGRQLTNTLLDALLRVGTSNASLEEEDEDGGEGGEEAGIVIAGEDDEIVIHMTEEELEEQKKAFEELEGLAEGNATGAGTNG